MLNSRRTFITGLAAAAGSAFATSALPVWARSTHDAISLGVQELSGNNIDLHVSQQHTKLMGKRAHPVLINNQLPAPLLRFREGDAVTLRVHNHLQDDTSIHWHGLLLPYQMDGVPGVSFPGIAPGEVFTYHFPIRQAGTYWYHSHSGLQEQLGHYGPIIIDALEDPVHYDREYVVVLSDWTFEHPHRVFANLKKMEGVYIRQQRTVKDFFRDVEADGLDTALAARMMWGEMRMNQADISDVTASTYTYLTNGHSPQENWTALYRPGERVRLRFINASAMSIFFVRIPGLPMTVVQADGLNVKPVEVDEFQIGTAETFDVVVTPADDTPYAIFCEANDSSGYACATLATTPGARAIPPQLRLRPLLTMKDMAMDHGSGGQMDQSGHHHGHHMPMQAPQTHDHAQGPGVAGLAALPANRLAERPLGLADAPHRVLVYSDLQALERNPDVRAPEREIELHLTSNMERYMWSFDGLKFSEVREPITFWYGERLRMWLVNDTMMPHPIHLHGMFFDVVTDEQSEHKPRKHTIVVKPGEKLAVDITPDAPGEWAFHCHLLYHMHAGMMRTVAVRDRSA